MRAFLTKVVTGINRFSFGFSSVLVLNFQSFCELFFKAFTRAVITPSIIGYVF